MSLPCDHFCFIYISIFFNFPHSPHNSILIIMSQHFLEVFLHVAFSNQWISYLGCRFRVEVEVES